MSHEQLAVAIVEMLHDDGFINQCPTTRAALARCQVLRLINEHADHEWQPIETAPKGDFVQIRLWNGHEWEGTWSPNSNVWYSTDESGITLSPQPTHWRPKAKGPA